MKYRSRMDISAAILEIAQGGSIKTNIMYRAFISFPQLKEYLEMLTAAKMLDYDETIKQYFTTEKGKQFLKMYKDVGQKMMPETAKRA